MALKEQECHVEEQTEEPRQRLAPTSTEHTRNKDTHREIMKNMKKIEERKTRKNDREKEEKQEERMSHTKREKDKKNKREKKETKKMKEKQEEKKKEKCRETFIFWFVVLAELINYRHPFEMI